MTTENFLAVASAFIITSVITALIAYWNIKWNVNSLN